MITRSQANFSPKTFREEDNSVEFVLSTETPATIYDWAHGYIDETLIAKGVKLPKNKQIPLLDCHNRYELDDVIGSVRDFVIEDNRVIGRLYFANSEKAQQARNMVKDGFLDSGSVGYAQLDSQFVNEGETYEYQGKIFKGPALITKSWELHEFSLVPVPADKNAKARNFIDSANCAVNSTKEKFAMDKDEEKNTQTVEQPTVDNSKEIERAVNEAKKAEQENERARVVAIITLCEKHNCRDLAEHLISQGMTLEAAQSEVLEELAKRNRPVSGVKSTITVGEDEKDKFRNAAIDGLLIRAKIDVSKPATGSEDFAKMGFTDLAREVLYRNGKRDVYGKENILNEVFRYGAQSTSDFSYILNASMRKTVMAGFNQIPQTWRIFCSTGELPDLEVHHSVAMDDMPDLKVNPEGAEVKAVTLTDRGHTRQLETYAALVKLTRRALLADDLGFFSEMARMFGVRAAAKIEQMAYSALTNGDNYTTNYNKPSSGAALSKTSLAAAYAKMMKHTTQNGTPIYTAPKYLIVSPDDALTASLLANSQNDVSAQAEGAPNFFKTHGLIAIDSPYITTGFYLVGDKAQVPSIRVNFLNGNEAPTVEEKANIDHILGKEWLCYIDIGVDVQDVRSLYYTPAA